MKPFSFVTRRFNMKLLLAIFCLAAPLALTWAEEITGQNPIPIPLKVINGTSRPGTRVISGTDAYLGLIPYQAAILTEKKNGITYLNGGVLIAPNWVLTTASCVYGASSFTVRLGSLNYNQGGQTFFTTYSIIHAYYRASPSSNDIGLIRLNGNAVYNSYVQPIRIASSCVAFSNVRVGGWGYMTETGPISTTLKYTDLNALTVTQCARFFEYGVISYGHFCTVGSVSESLCNGDGGSPAIDPVSKQLVGFVSFLPSSGCSSGAPIGHTYVPYYRYWIRDNTGLKNI